MKKGIEAIQNVCGVTPVGFRAPEGELTLDTLRIAKKYGMHYSSNLCDDDRPYQKDLEMGETLLEIPIIGIIMICHTLHLIIIRHFQGTGKNCKLYGCY